jgi:hypothetical protein
MKSIRKIVFTPVLVMAFQFGVWAQQTTVTTGGDTSNASGSLSYSIGQVFYSVYSETTGSEWQGVQQPYEIWVMTTNRIAKSSYKLTVYPNPTAGIITLKTPEMPQWQTTCQLYNTEGQKIMDLEIVELETHFDFSSYEPGTYILIVKEKNLLIASFKIIKN